MENEFNPEEILEIACNLERNGAEFYRRAAELVSSKEAEEMLNRLAAMEDEHEDFFESVRSDPSALIGLFGEPERELSSFLQAITENKVFPKEVDPLGQLHEDVTVKEIIEMAIDAEKSAIQFYKSLKEVIPNQGNEGKLDRIIQEEFEHVRILTGELEAQTS